MIIRRIPVRHKMEVRMDQACPRRGHKVGQHYCIFESNPPLRDKREREFGGHAFHVFFAKRTRVLKGLLYCFFYISGYRHLELQVHYSRSSPGKRVKPELKIQELFIKTLGRVENRCFS